MQLHTPGCCLQAGSFLPASKGHMHAYIMLTWFTRPDPPEGRLQFFSFDLRLRRGPSTDLSAAAAGGGGAEGGALDSILDTLCRPCKGKQTDQYLLG